MTNAINKAKRLSGINTLAYLGIEPTTAPLLIVNSSSPTALDRAQNQIGALWIVPPTGNPVVPATSQIWVLTSIFGPPPGGATWVELEQSGGGAAIESIVTDNGTVIPVAHVINENGGTSVGGVATNINTYANPNLSNNLVVALNNSIYQPNSNNTGTQGMYALGGNTTASRFLFNYGTNNTFLGNGAGNLTLTTASATANTIIGATSAVALTTGNNNCTLGFDSLSSETTGSGNIAIGSSALASQNGLTGEIGIGYQALTSETNAGGNNGNTAIGYQAATTQNGGYNNTFCGYQAGQLGTNPFSCTGIGAAALQNQTGGNSNTAVGTRCLENITTGLYNVALGSDAGAGGSTATAGGSARNVIIGRQAAQLMGNTFNNIMIGFQAGLNMNNGSANPANTQNNVMVGPGSMSVSTWTGNNNTAIGYNTLASVTTSTNNTVLGAAAASNVLTGSYNNIIGQGSASNYVGAESSNILINHAGVASENNTIHIGTQGSGSAQQNTTYIAGIFGKTVGVGSGTAVFIDNTGLLGTVVSSERYKNNIEILDDDSEVIYDLMPVTFTYKEDPQEHIHYGLIAEDVESIFPELVTYNAEGLPESVKYHDLPVLLLNELKKLRTRIEELEDRLESM